MHKAEGRSQLFTLRVWPENTGDGAVEWRGKVQRVADGETLYFRLPEGNPVPKGNPDWSDVRDFVFHASAAYERAQGGEPFEVKSDGRGPNDGQEER